MSSLQNYGPSWTREVETVIKDCLETTEDDFLNTFHDAVAWICLDLGLTNRPDRYPTESEAVDALERRMDRPALAA